MDKRIGIIGGTHPTLILSGLPVPERPYPITRQLNATHYVVQDIHPTVDVEAIITQLRDEIGAGAVVVSDEQEEEADDDTD